jgi:flagellar export protein FliJ
MKRFQFSLDRVLGYKNQMLDREKNELARLRVIKTQMDEELKDLVKEFQSVSQQMTVKAQKGISALELRSYQFQLDCLRDDMDLLNDKRHNQDILIEDQLAVVLELSQSVSGLDKLKDHQKEEFAKYEAKVAENEIAEFITGKLALPQEA